MRAINLINLLRHIHQTMINFHELFLAFAFAFTLCEKPLINGSKRIRVGCHRRSGFHWNRRKLMEFSRNGMERKFSEFIEFKESDKSLRHELGSTQRSCLSHLSCMCCGSILVSDTRDSRFELFYRDDKYFYRHL